MEIILPKRTADLRIRHYEAMKDTDWDNLTDIMEQVRFVSKATGISEKRILSIDAKDMIRMYLHLVELYAGINIRSAPPKQVELNGRIFNRIDPEKVGVGWHADWSKADIDKDPVWLACLMYYPDGSYYGEIDEQENLVHPAKDRYNLIRDHLPLEVFIQSAAFFLTCAERSMRRSILKKQHQSNTEKFLNRILSSGKMRSMLLRKNTSPGTGTKHSK